MGSTNQQLLLGKNLKPRCCYIFISQGLAVWPRKLIEEGKDDLRNLEKHVSDWNAHGPCLLDNYSYVFVVACLCIFGLYSMYHCKYAYSIIYSKAFGLPKIYGLEVSNREMQKVKKLTTQWGSQCQIYDLEEFASFWDAKNEEFLFYFSHLSHKLLDVCEGAPHIVTGKGIPLVENAL